MCNPPSLNSSIIKITPIIQNNYCSKYYYGYVAMGPIQSPTKHPSKRGLSLGHSGPKEFLMVTDIWVKTFLGSDFPKISHNWVLGWTFGSTWKKNQHDYLGPHGCWFKTSSLTPSKIGTWHKRSQAAIRSAHGASAAAFAFALALAFCCGGSWDQAEAPKGLSCYNGDLMWFIPNIK